MPKFSKKRSRSAKGTKRRRFSTKRSKSAKGFKRRRSFKKARYGYHLTAKAGAKFARRRKNAVPANKSMPDETTTWLGGEFIVVGIDLASATTEYMDWSLNGPLDWQGSLGSGTIPGWTKNVASYNFYRPLGSSTQVHIWQVQAGTMSTDHFAGMEVALVPMDAASTPVASGTAYVDGVINTDNALFWRNCWPHTTGRLLTGSDFNTNAGHATLKGAFTNWSALTGQFSQAERHDPVFLTAKAAALSTGKKCSWNLIINSVNPTAMEEFSFQMNIRVRHKIEFSVKDTASYTYDEAQCKYLQALKQSEVYRVIRVRNGKIPRGQPGWLVDKPQYIGICDTPGESKGDSKGDTKDDDMDFESLSITPKAVSTGAGPGTAGPRQPIAKPLQALSTTASGAMRMLPKATGKV